MEKITVLKLIERIPDESVAYAYLEGLRWNGTPECPHCGESDRCYFLTPKAPRTTSTGRETQRRLWKCSACRKKFSVLTGTVMHGTKIPVRTWVLVLFEMVANKNGISAREIERKYGLTPKSAWFLTQRIREAMKSDGLVTMLSGTVQADETFIGGQAKYMHARDPRKAQQKQGGPGKAAVLSLVHPESGEVRSRVLPDVTGASLRKAIAEQVDMPATILHTDSATTYRTFAHEMAAHEFVNHGAGEYARPGVTTNHAEGYFSQLKRSIDGTHHHVSRDHLARYLAEFDYRYTTRTMSDTERMSNLLARVGGKRLSYRPLVSGSVS